MLNICLNLGTLPHFRMFSTEKDKLHLRGSNLLQNFVCLKQISLWSLPPSSLSELNSYLCLHLYLYLCLCLYLSNCTQRSPAVGGCLVSGTALAGCFLLHPPTSHLPTQPFTIGSHPHWNRFRKTGVGVPMSDHNSQF